MGIVVLVAPFAAYLPNAAMAGVLLLVAWGLIDLMLEIKGAWDAMPESVRATGGNKFATDQQAG